MDNFIFDKLGLQKVINASGRMTKLGVSTLSKEVSENMARGGESYVIIDQLLKESGIAIGKKLGVEDAFITNSASAGLALAVASVINKGHLKYVEYFHKYLHELKREIILPKGHNVNYGTTVEGIINLGGGIVVEAGSSNECSKEHVESMITDETAALVYIKSHHCVQKNMLSIDEMQEVASRYNLPLIVDAAAEEDLYKYAKYDISIFSGAKAIEGPSSGIVIGKKKYIDNIFMQNKGIGRAMKVDKALVAGIMKALFDYLDREEEEATWQKEALDEFGKKIGDLKYIKFGISKDEAGRDIYRGEIRVEASCPLSAKEILVELQKGDTAIFTRDYKANIGIFHIDPRPLKDGDLDIIADKLRKIIENI